MGRGGLDNRLRNSDAPGRSLGAYVYGARLVSTPLRLGTRTIATPEDMNELGQEIGRSLRAGDVLVLTGPLGAGKTTLTRGIGDGLGVRGPVTSPTFVLARTHPSVTGGPPLVHVDAYRLA